MLLWRNDGILLFFFWWYRFFFRYGRSFGHVEQSIKIEQKRRAPNTKFANCFRSVFFECFIIGSMGQWEASLHLSHENYQLQCQWHQGCNEERFSHLAERSSCGCDLHTGKQSPANRC